MMAKSRMIFLQVLVSSLFCSSFDAVAMHGAGHTFESVILSHQPRRSFSNTKASLRPNHCPSRSKCHSKSKEISSRILWLRQRASQRRMHQMNQRNRTSLRIYRVKNKSSLSRQKIRVFLKCSGETSTKRTAEIPDSIQMIRSRAIGIVSLRLTKEAMDNKIDRSRTIITHSMTHKVTTSATWAQESLTDIGATVIRHQITRKCGRQWQKSGTMWIRTILTW